ncbi:hypothetical protein D3C75_954810 [compost metagenome]
MLDHVQEMFLGEGVERQPQAKTVGQGNLVFHRFTGVQLAVHALPVLVVALLLRHQVAAVGGGVQQHVVGGLLERAVEHALEHPVVALPGFERQVVAEQDEALRQLLQLLDYTRQVGQVVAFDFDQAQAGADVLGQQGAHQ